MSLLDVLRAGVKIADGITKPFQGTVQYRQCTSKDGLGEKVLKSVVSLRAIIDQTQRQVRTREGQFMVVSASMDFLDVAAVKTATGGLGFSMDDEFTLPDGKKRPTLSAGGFVDAGTTRPVVYTVMLG
jgi:hypothetical protein